MGNFIPGAVICIGHAAVLCGSGGSVYNGCLRRETRIERLS